MGTYYVYCNHTRKEFVTLSDLRDGGDKLNAVYYCAEALIYLMDPCANWQDKYRGRWHKQPTEECPRIEVLPDCETDTYDLEESMGYTNISRPLLIEMVSGERSADGDYVDRGRFSPPPREDQS